MTDFTFQTTPEVVSRAGATAEIGPRMAALGLKRIGFVTDAPIRALGLTKGAERSMAEAGLSVEVATNIVPDPPEALVEEITARFAGCAGIAAVGGGSVLDAAKVVAAGLGSNQPLAQMYGVGQVTGARLPLILAPTTAGTGSEVTPIAILTTGAAQKMGIVAPQLLPDVALLDATLTLGLPQDQTAATGVDAMVHAVEAYTSAHHKNPLSDALAREALALLSCNIETVCTTPSDLTARQAMLLGSCFAGMAFANAPVAAVHALAYPLGGHFKVPHGLSNALVLPDVLAFNAPVAGPLYDELAAIAFPGGKGLEAGFRTLAPRIGLATRLAEVGVRESDLDLLACDAMRQTRLLVNNPREVTVSDAKAIYAAAL